MLYIGDSARESNEGVLHNCSPTLSYRPIPAKIADVAWFTVHI